MAMQALQVRVVVVGRGVDAAERGELAEVEQALPLGRAQEEVGAPQLLD